MKRILLSLLILLIAQRVSTQELATAGNSQLRLGMSLKFVKANFPTAKFKKEIFEASEEGGGGFTTGSIYNKAGKLMANAYFDENEKINCIDFFSDFDYYGVKPGSLFKDLKTNDLIRSTMYLPDGDGNEIGLWITLKKYSNVEAQIELTKEIKAKLIKFGYQEVPVNVIPLTAVIRCIRVIRKY